jgi:hypothetical protein
VTTPNLTTEVQPFSAPAFSAMEKVWRELELRCEPAHYSLTHEWLTAWIAVYRPSELLLVRISDGERLRAVGLLECLSGGRRRFAGGAVTPHRRLLCAPVDETAAWMSWGRWLEENRSFALKPARGRRHAGGGPSEARAVDEVDRRTLACRLPWRSPCARASTSRG